MTSSPLSTDSDNKRLYKTQNIDNVRWREEKLTFGSKLGCFLSANPQFGDVVFKVGQEGELVKTFRLALVVESPVFEKLFASTWNASIVNRGEPIRLPDVSPNIFRIFLKLLTDDNYEKTLQSLNLSITEKLELIILVDDCQVLKLLNWTNSTMQELVSDFPHFMMTDDFLKLSNQHLNHLLSNDDIPLEEIQLFEAACRWAGNQCQVERREISGSNFRLVLGETLFSIRFYQMTKEEFAENIVPSNILTQKEVSEIFRIIDLPEEKRDTPTLENLSGGLKKRSKNSVISLIQLMSKLNPHVKTKESPFPDGFTSILSSNFFELTITDLDVQFSNFESTEGSKLWSNNPIPPLSQLYYFEVMMVDKDAQGYLRMGFMTVGKQYHFYYRSDGYVTKYVRKDDKGVSLPKWNWGDVIGCGVHFLDEKRNECFLTKNGELLGSVVVVASQGNLLKPFVKVGCPMTIQINLGQKPFKFNILDKKPVTNSSPPTTTRGQFYI